MNIETPVKSSIARAAQLSPEKQFVPGRLPWLLAAAAWVLYFLTRNDWVSLKSLEPVVMVSGWNWQPELTRPLYWLFTYPIRLLPPLYVPLALNLFSTVCASLTIALLARSVALLPHDRTEEQRLREPSAFSLLSIRMAWLPVVVAVVLCGLQLTFWENATAASSDMFDLLLFAYVVRCLLEFRLYGSDSWLLRATFVYAAAMTGNWAMVAFFPVFLAALIWTKGIGFFNLRFLRQMFFLGTAGLCFFLVLPAVASFSGSEIGFWQGLKANLGNQKNFLSILLTKYWLFQSERPFWILSLFSILPLLVIAFRSPAYFGDPSKIGVFLANSIFQILYAAFFVICLWVLLDPPFSPRNYVGTTALPLYYLAALSIGYFTGYFLLVFGGAKPMLRNRPLADYPRVLNIAVTAAVYVLVLLPVALVVYRNVPQIRTTNGPFLRQFSEFLIRDLPQKNAVVLSDDPGRLFLIEALLKPGHAQDNLMVVHTASLPSPGYHQFLKKAYPAGWNSGVTTKRKDVLENLEIQRLVVGMSASNAIYYAHPSFGYYFEEFYPEAHGLNYRLERYPTNSIHRPALTAELIAGNQAFWQGLAATTFPQLIKTATVPQNPKPTGLMGRLMARLYLRNYANFEASTVAAFYSRALNSWGVELQRNGKLPEAELCFTEARDLYEDNVAAEINRQSNERQRANQKGTIQSTRYIEAQLGKYLTVQNLLNANGPVDEATLCYNLGQEFFGGSNYRQAAQEFDRVTFLAPSDIPQHFQSRVAFANACLYRQIPDPALQTVRELKAQGISPTNAAMLLRLEAFSLLFKGDPAGAQKAVAETVRAYPEDETLLALATDFYINLGFETNALETIEQQLKVRPENTSAMVNKGLVHLRLGNYTNCIPPLNEVIDQGPTASADTNIYYAALYNRGLAHWKSEHYDEARQDFEEFQKIYPERHELSYVLGEIGYTRGNTNDAIRYFQRYLASTPPTNAPETSNALAKLKELQQRVVRQ